MTPLQTRILAAWEALHPRFQAVLDANHHPTRFAPWRFLVVLREEKVQVGMVTRYTQDMDDPRYEPIVTQLRNSLKHGHLPISPAPKTIRQRDPVSGQILPRRLQAPALPTSITINTKSPKPPLLTGKAALLWKYGPHGTPKK